MIERRSFLLGILAAGVGPAIVRATSLMPVKALDVINAADFDINHLLVRGYERYSIGYVHPGWIKSTPDVVRYLGYDSIFEGEYVR